MNSSPAGRVAILAPFLTAALEDHIPGLCAGDEIPPGMGGSNIVHLVRARLAAGLATDVITLDPSARAALQCWQGKLARLWVVRRRPRRALRDGFRAERALLAEALRQSGASLCHAHWTQEYGLAAVAQTHMPHVVSVHDHAARMLGHVGIRQLPLYLLARRVYARAAVLTGVSPYVAEYAARVAGKPVAVVANPLSDLVWNLAARPAQRDPGRPEVVSAVSWARFKNVTTALHAFALARKMLPAARYTLLGPGLEAAGPAADWARRTGLAAGVTFAGAWPYPETLARIRDADVLLHPSREESWGSPVAEAMAFGVPVVACHDARGPAWLLEGGQGGALVAGRDAPAMADALCAALQPAESVRQRARAAEQRIRALCDPAAVLQGYAEAYARATCAAAGGLN